MVWNRKNWRQKETRSDGMKHVKIFYFMIINAILQISRMCHTLCLSLSLSLSLSASLFPYLFSCSLPIFSYFSFYPISFPYLFYIFSTVSKFGVIHLLLFYWILISFFNSSFSIFLIFLCYFLFYLKALLFLSLSLLPVINSFFPLFKCLLLLWLFTFDFEDEDEETLIEALLLDDALGAIENFSWLLLSSLE